MSQESNQGWGFSLDSIGEALSGVSDSAKSIYDDWTNTGQSNTQAAASAAPELNRETEAAAQQPTGELVNPNGNGMFSQQTLLILGGLLVVLLVVLLALKR